MFAHFVVSWTLLGSIADVQREPHNDQEIVVVPLLTDVQREPHNDQEIVVVSLLTALCEQLIRILENHPQQKVSQTITFKRHPHAAFIKMHFASQEN